MPKDRTNRGKITTQRPRVLDIQLNTGVPSDADGSVTAAWTKIGTASSVAWTSGSGSSHYLADQPRDDDSAIIRIRYRTDITLTPRLHRFAYQGRALAINAVIDVQNQHQYLDVYVREEAL